MRIKAESEDLIYKQRTIIKELNIIQQAYYDNLVDKLKEIQGDSWDDEVDNWLYDYIFNSDDEVSFEEFLID